MDDLPPGSKPIDEHDALRLSMAACTGVAAIAKWMAAQTDNKDAARDMHTVMLANLGLPPGPDRDQGFAATFLQSVFGPDHMPK